jgi:GNAT superfamily N-acetyltransferase
VKHPVTILKAQKLRDFQRFHELFVEYEAYLPANLRHGQVPEAQALARTYAEPNVAFLAMKGGDAIGCVAVRRTDATTGTLHHLFVQPQHRGLGAARGLVTTAIDFLRERGYARMLLDTNKEELPAAYNLYRSLGFTECEPFDTVGYDHPTFMDLYLSS